MKQLLHNITKIIRIIINTKKFTFILAIFSCSLESQTEEISFRSTVVVSWHCLATSDSASAWAGPSVLSQSKAMEMENPFFSSESDALKLDLRDSSSSMALSLASRRTFYWENKFLFKQWNCQFIDLIITCIIFIFEDWKLQKSSEKFWVNFIFIFYQ